MSTSKESNLKYMNIVITSKLKIFFSSPKKSKNDVLCFDFSVLCVVVLCRVVLGCCAMQYNLM